jgi:hypothetical protein
MMVCTQCGFQNETEDAFCGSCGAFLEWAGEKVETAPPPPKLTEPGTETASEPEPPTAMTAGETPESEVDLRTGDEVAEEPADASVRSAALVTDSPALARTGAPAATGRPPTQASPPQAPPAQPPGGGSGPVARRPDAVKPATPRARPVPAKPPPRRDVRPGDLICSQCEEGNDPDRRFCRRCGNSLLEAKEAVEVVAPPPVPWWKRPFVREQPKVAAAGERPMRRGGIGAPRTMRTRMSQARRAIALLAVLGLAVGFAGPWRSKVSGLFRGARESVAPKLSPITPVDAGASSSLPGHPPTMAIDRTFGGDNYWAEGAEGDGEKERLILTFDPPIHLGQVGFRLGASSTQAEFVAQPRPREVRLHFSDGSTKDLKLKDTADFQPHAVNAKNTGKLEIEILEVFKATQGGSNCAIADIEFFQRS